MVHSDGSLTVLLNLVVVLDRLYVHHTISHSILSAFFESSIPFNRTRRILHIHFPCRDRERTMLTDGEQAGCWSSRVAGQILLHGRK